ncbi:MAG: S8 family peptidase, partial [Betaproteobacteria bacterium]
MKGKTKLLALALSAVAMAGWIPAAAADELGASPGAAKQPKTAAGRYIVRLADPPVVAYDGGIAGLSATRPAKGRKIDVLDRNVIRYADHLEAKHNDVLARSNGGRKLYSYKFVFNGFAAELTRAQLEAIKAAPGVIAVEPDELRHLDTVSTPHFLGLDAPSTGLWAQLGGQSSAGEDIVIGMVDSGIWPEHPSLSDRTGVGPNGQTGKLNYQQLPGWNAKCQNGEAFNNSNCNKKLIGAQYFIEGKGGAANVKADFPYEYISPRDADGHGTHTSTTAGGNGSTVATAEGIVLGNASGIAPRARISTYKVCWGRLEPTAGCATSDSVAAIDQAVADGVDVINYSISGTRTNFRDPVEIAFLFAHDAGVFVAASAGNSGPGNFTVAHISPWLTTVAAGSHDRFYGATVTLGNGAVYSGASLGTGVSSRPTVLSVNVPKAGVAAADAARCFIGSLDAAKAAGKIVVCDRGVTART